MRVVIGGAGVAALEAAAALRHLAAGRVSVTLVAPDRMFRTRALQPLAAFGIDSPRGVPIHALADELDAELIADRVGWIDRDRYTVHCRSGHIIAFQALVLAVGATVHVCYPQALTLHEGAGAGLTQLVSDITSGDVRRIAFVAPEPMAWPLPLYETALMTAALGREHHLRLRVTLVTGEAAPLQAFGDRAGAELRSLLDRHDIDLVTARRCQVPAADRVVLLGEHAGGDPGAHRRPSGGAPSIDRPAHPRSPLSALRLHPDRSPVPGPRPGRCLRRGRRHRLPGQARRDRRSAGGGRRACIAAAAGADVPPHPFHPTLSGIAPDRGDAPLPHRAPHRRAPIRIRGGRHSRRSRRPAGQGGRPYLTGLLREAER